jgi:hypothetical protein
VLLNQAVAAALAGVIGKAEKTLAASERKLGRGADLQRREGVSSREKP